MESSLAYGPVKLSGEYIYANYQGVSNTNTVFDHDIKAWYADLNWLVTGENWADFYKNGVYGRIRPKANMGLQKGWGAIERNMIFNG